MLRAHGAEHFKFAPCSRGLAGTFNDAGMDRFRLVETLLEPLSDEFGFAGASAR